MGETELTRTHLDRFERRENPGKLHILGNDAREQLQMLAFHSMGTLRVAEWHTDLDGPVGLPADLAVVDHDESTAWTAASVRELQEFRCTGANDIRQLAGGRVSGRCQNRAVWNGSQRHLKPGGARLAVSVQRALCDRVLDEASQGLATRVPFRFGFPITRYEG